MPKPFISLRITLVFSIELLSLKFVLLFPLFCWCPVKKGFNLKLLLLVSLIFILWLFWILLLLFCSSWIILLLNWLFVTLFIFCPGWTLLLLFWYSWIIILLYWLLGSLLLLFLSIICCGCIWLLLISIIGFCWFNKFLLSLYFLKFKTFKINLSDALYSKQTSLVKSYISL